MKLNQKLFLPVLVLFILVSGILLSASRQLAAGGIRQDVLLAGNIILCAATCASLLLYRNAMLHKTTPGFLGNAYGGVLLKLFICGFAVAIYVFTARNAINKPALFICVFLYVVYTVVEMRSLMKWNKDRNNG